MRWERLIKFLERTEKSVRDEVFLAFLLFLLQCMRILVLFNWRLLNQKSQLLSQCFVTWNESCPENVKIDTVRHSSLNCSLYRSIGTRMEKEMWVSTFFAIAENISPLLSFKYLTTWCASFGDRSWKKIGMVCVALASRLPWEWATLKTIPVRW